MWYITKIGRAFRSVVYEVGARPKKRRSAHKMANKPQNALTTSLASLAATKAALPAKAGDNEGPARLEHLGQKKVRVTYSWRASKNAPKQTKTSVLNFSTVSETQLIELAISTVVIDVQHVLRVAANTHPGKPVDPNLMAEVDVLKDVVQATALKGDPIARAVMAARAAGLPEAEVVKLAERLRATAAA